MGWCDLDEDFLELSQKSADSVEAAEAARLSDGGSDCEPAQPEFGSGSNGCWSGSGSGSGDQSPWWVELLKDSTAHLRTHESPATGPMTIVSGCSGMLAEAFVLQAWA
ncbi:unnamed protein product [Symbiodinium sp. CCMP2592]|nr:unnamed protein product [Symbiodinium sp. CCMP2592]CAE7432404.1 unnamed protein product [Symbiodinium sp. CCMP2592]CAE7834453.1 unnamed protein product [Symbiodinium sp. CCMP2592]